MSETSERVPCLKCGAMILPITAKTYQGLCAKCNREARWAEEDKARAAAASPPAPLPAMEVRADLKEFDERQIHLVREIVRAIKHDLADSGLPSDSVAEFTGDIAFSIATILDGSRVMQAEGRPLVPVLTFAEDEERTRLIGRPGGSFMHEIVFATVDEIFDEDTD